MLMDMFVDSMKWAVDSGEFDNEQDVIDWMMNSPQEAINYSFDVVKTNGMLE